MEFIEFNLDNDGSQEDLAYHSKLAEIDIEKTFLLYEDQPDWSFYEEIPMDVQQSYEIIETSIYAPAVTNAKEVKGKICSAMSNLYAEKENMKPQIETLK